MFTFGLCQLGKFSMRDFFFMLVGLFGRKHHFVLIV